MTNTNQPSIQVTPSFTGPEAISRLTRSERLVLTFIAEGFSQKAIAAKLHRSVDTVKSHRRTLGKKLGSSNRVELTRLAIEHGMVSLNGDQGRAEHLPLQHGISNSGMVPVALVNPNGECTSVSPNFARILGHLPEGLAGRRIDELMTLESEFELAELLRRVASGSFAKASGVVRRPDRSLASITVQFLPLPPPTKHVYVVLSEVTVLPRCVEIGDAMPLSAAG